MPNEPRGPQEQDKTNGCARKCRRGRIEGSETPEQIQDKNASLSPQSYRTRENMALFSFSATALAGYIAKTAAGLNTVRSDYRNADKDSRYIQLQKEHLQLNQSMLN